MTPQLRKTNTKKAAASLLLKVLVLLLTKGEAGQIKESDVAKMSAKEFEAREDEINKAMRSGKFVYDLVWCSQIRC
jgi:hypothetical protein